MFESAVRMKLRFNYKGLCSVEDLWDLSVQELDAIFKGLNTKLKEQKEESLLNQKTAADEVLALQVDIVKHIVEVKLAEQEKRENNVLRTERKKKLLSIIADKQDDDLQNMSIEELNELVDKL